MELDRPHQLLLHAGSPRVLHDYAADAELESHREPGANGRQPTAERRADRDQPDPKSNDARPMGRLRAAWAVRARRRRAPDVVGDHPLRFLTQGSAAGWSSRRPSLINAAAAVAKRAHAQASAAFSDP